MSASMRAAVFAAPGVLEVVERAYPKLAGPDEVLIDVEACGVCGTDLHILSDPPGHPATVGVVMGHEFVGVVVERGPAVVGVDVGDRVVITPNLSCGSCASCKHGVPSCCEHFSAIGIFRDGGLAARVSVPARACHRIGPDLPARVAALAEPISCVMNGMRQARPLPGERAVVFGAGPIGLIFCALLRASGARCVAVEPDEMRRRAATRMGAERALPPDGDVRAVAADADIVVDTVGSQLPAALNLVRPRGRVLLFGMNQGSAPPVRQYDITRKELVVFGTYVGDFTMPDAVRVLEDGAIDVEPIVSHWVGLEELPAALAEARAGRAVKIVVDVRGGGADGRRRR